LAPRITLHGERICVTGPISDYQGKPEIVIADPNQLAE
jgi:DNA/RNA endonuclease YhcR with UshA esterase domain